MSDTSAPHDDAPRAPEENGGHGRLLQESDLNRFQPGYDSRMAIRPDGLNYRVPARFLGMEPRSYLILRLSPLGGASREIYPFLYRDNPVRIFLASEGTLQGYLCSILAYTTAPYRHLYLSYPSQGEFYTLREHDRFECHLPARVRQVGCDGREEFFEGMVADISLGGCSMIFRTDPEAPAPFAPGGEAVLCFSMLSPGRESVARCTVRGVRRLGSKVALGLSFDGLAPTSRERIVEFLAYLQRFRRAGASFQPL